MDFELTADEKKFRDEVRSWLKANKPPEDGAVDTKTFIENRRKWQRTLYDAGYVGMTWPKEFGGQGRTFMDQLIFNDEMILAHAPEPINVIGLGMGGPVVIAHGTEEQKKRYLAPLLSAEEIWCQGFSEPNAGSDLSGLQTRAEDRGDHYVVNGQKVWTTLAHVARWCMLVARERKESNPRAGLTYLLVDMESAGIEVRPLVQITGDAEFNEIFFKDVKVPKSQILGEAGNGWAVAMTTLLHERGTLGLALATRAQITASELAERARRLGCGSDPLVRQKIAQHTIEARALQLNGYRAVTAVKRNGIPGPEGSILKLMWSELNQRMTETAMDVGGAGSQVGDGDGWKYSFLRARANTIEAGTSEVLRNILAERVLG
ncbi:MAG TPA: acyl-CoA dehydrogenase family protein, partial [Candidatus Dormibacteraeota bacterium]|nr:acyl-CoA dehydrogenase family protein [Candidatus Dormibacteraeota bacterium]